MTITYSSVFDPAVDSTYFYFRLPAILTAGDGNLLAFAEGRVDSSDDDGNINIVMKRSTDDGATWGTLTNVADDGSAKLGNPVPILDTANSNTVVLHYTRTGYDSVGTIGCNTVAEADRRRPFIRKSTNHGVSFGSATEITSQVKGTDFRHFVGGPGHGLCLQSGPNAGRLVVAGAHSEWSGNQADTCETWAGAYIIYSDDGGTTWSLGATDAPASQTVEPNEASIVELSDGHLYLNVRDQATGATTNRVQAWSEDGGATFKTGFSAVTESVFTVPKCHCSLWRLSAANDPTHQRLLFAGPADTADRDQIVLRQSFDGGRAWYAGPTIESGQGGYSDLAEQGSDLVCLYENGNGTIKFARVPIADIARPTEPVRGARRVML